MELHTTSQRTSIIHWTSTAFKCFALALLVLFIGYVPVRAQAGEPLTIASRVTPNTGRIDTAEFNVELTLTGNSSLCPAQEISRPSDILLVIDRSNSMSKSAGANVASTKLELLKDAAKAFIQQVNLNRDQIGVVQFDDLANVVTPLTNDRTRIETAIDSLAPGNGTSVALGIEQARREFIGGGRIRGDSSRVMIVLSDGGTPQSDAINAATTVKAEGTRIISIALGDGANQDLMRQLASQASDYTFVSDASQLRAIYEGIARQIIRPLAARNIVVTHTFDATAMDVDPSSITGNGTLSGNTITWQVRELLDQGTVLSYKVHPRSPGNFTIDRTTKVDYMRCETEAKSLQVPPGLTIQVQALPSPTATVTPRPTLTLGPPPPPTPTPSFPEVVQQSTAAFICAADWLNLLLWLLVLLFLIWWIWQFIQELRKAEGTQNPCRWIPWLFLPLMLILLMFLLPLFAGSGCGARESVYFWRITSGERNGAIYVTDRGGLNRARPLTTISQNQCVGCHAVSSSTYRISSIVGNGSGLVDVHTLDGKAMKIPEVYGSYTAWSPDGTKLAVSTADQIIVIIDIVQGSVTPLKGADDATFSQEMPAWSPDGQNIAFVRGPRSSLSYAMTGSSSIYVVPAIGGVAAPLVGASEAGFNYYPSFSPDGRWLAFTRHLSGTTTYAAPEAEIFIVSSTGGTATRLAANDAPDGTALHNVSNSWATWSRDGTLLAFTSKRNDPSYDIFITKIDANGLSGSAEPLAGAAEPGIFEHLPFWGVPPIVNPWQALLDLWWCLIPFLLVLLAWILCRRLHVKGPQQPEPVSVKPPLPPLPATPLQPLWQVAPTLIVGVGGTGRWVLTHLKKNLRDGGGGQMPEKVRFILLDTSEREQTNRFKNAQGELTNVEFAGVALAPDEVFLMGQNLSEVVKHVRENPDSALADWLPAVAYQRLGMQALDLAAGTNGRRPLARVALIDKLRAGTVPNTASQPVVPAGTAKTTDAINLPVARDARDLWQALLDYSAEVKDVTLVRIVVVGSLTGGMSGTLFDLAYLARLAARSLAPTPDVYLEGYITTPDAYRQVLPRDGGLARLQLNAMAATREMERLQRYRGAPVRFHYTANGVKSDQHAHLDNELKWPLFDTITVFGGNANPERGIANANLGIQKSLEPWATTFASMADTIALRMERSIANSRGQQMQTLLAEADTRQNETHQTVVASAGSMVYRLPLVDILEIIRTRWAFQLLHLYLAGDTSQKLSLDPGQSGLPETYEQAAQRFLLGEHEAGVTPIGMRTAGLIASGAPIQARWVIAFSEPEGRAYAEYLSHALMLILNGRSDATERNTLGAPRIAYARAFVDEVRKQLAQASIEAEKLRANAPVGFKRNFWQRMLLWFGGSKASYEEWTVVLDRIKDWQTVTDQTAASLENLRALIFGTQNQPDGQPTFRGLYAELETQQALAEARRDQMNQVSVRRYLWSVPRDPDGDPSDPQNQQDLVERWDPIAKARIREYLPRFYWSMQRDGTIIFGIDRKKISVRSHADKDRAAIVQTLADAINALAIHATKDLREVPDQAFEIKDVLPTQLPSKEDRVEDRFVERTWEVSRPHLDAARDDQGDVDGRHSGIVCVPGTMQTDPRFRLLLQTFTALGTPSSRLGTNINPAATKIELTTDRTALMFLREYVKLPIMRIQEFRNVLRVYAENAGSEQTRGIDPALEATVFRAEHHALQYERRLESPLVVNQNFRLLHPLVVTALEHPEIAELYALAMAAGWLSVRGDRVLLTIPGDTERVLEQFIGEAHPLVKALVQLTSIRGPNEVVDRLRTQFADPSEQIKAAWRQFTLRYQPRAQIAAQTAAAATAPQTCQNPECKKFGQPLRPGAKFCGSCQKPVPPPPPAPLTPPTPVAPLGLPYADEPQEVQDLAAVGALAAAKRINPDDWKNLVMTRPRNVETL